MKIKNNSLSFIVLSVMIVAGSSCKKETKCVGGIGGQVTLKANLKHHSASINSLPAYRDTVYIRYNGLDYPANGLAGFNATLIGESGNSFVLITGLTCGDYYLYATGPDTTVAVGDTTRVQGGVSYSISQSSGTIEMTIPVTE